MKCRDCNHCEKGWFSSRPDEYVCIGVKEPLVINDINNECSEYKNLRSNKMKKIYVFGIFTGDSSYGVIRDAEPCGDVTGFAVDKLIVDPEDGATKLNSIASHWSSGVNWCKHDMGITSDWKHDVYKELYPDGYELEWLGCFNSGEEAYNTVYEMLSEV